MDIEKLEKEIQPLKSNKSAAQNLDCKVYIRQDARLYVGFSCVLTGREDNLLLTIDVGNTNTTPGLFNGHNLKYPLGFF